MDRIYPMWMKRVNLLKTRIPIFVGMIALVFVSLSSGRSETSLDKERLDLELRMQQRVELALSKIISPDQFVVVIRVIPLSQTGTAEQSQAGDNQQGYYLPGVPAITRFDGSVEVMNKLTNSMSVKGESFQKFVSRISATLLIDEQLPEELTTKARELTRQILGLDPERGDTLNVQQSVFNNAVKMTLPDTSISKFQKWLKSYWFLLILVFAFFCVGVFILFVFGPLRGFLNRLVQILPTLRPMEPKGGDRYGSDVQILPSLMQSMGMMPPPSLGMGGPSPANFSGSLQVENPNKRTVPFGFIREDHLSNLSTLLQREEPEKAAVVLGYLPTEWLIRVLSKMDPDLQTQITFHLAQTRQLLPEQVEDIEQDLKRRLDYLIGGPDRIIAVYESLNPDAQRRMLANLQMNQPEIAEEIRQRTLFFEDLDKFEPAGLKALLREVDLQTLVTSLKGMSKDFVDRMLEHLPLGKAEIVREELELGEQRVGRNTDEAQRKITLLAKRLEKDGQLNIPQISEEEATSRFSSPLRSTLKLPTEMRFPDEESTPSMEEGEVIAPTDNFREKFKSFMSRVKQDPDETMVDENPPDQANVG